MRTLRVRAAARRLAQRGSIAVETALALPILVAVGLVGVDMQRLHTERIRLENAAGSMALNLSAQSELTLAGLDTLAGIAMQGHEDRQQLVIMNVLQSGRISWALLRGGADALCDVPSAGGIYTGELPVDPPDEDGATDGDDASRLSLIVVQACRDTRDVSMAGGLTMPRDVLQTSSLFRAAGKTVTLDEELQAESDATGLAYSASS